MRATAGTKPESNASTYCITPKIRTVSRFGRCIGQEAVAAHKLTEHYAAWTETVGKMMAEPRTRSGIHPRMRFDFAARAELFSGRARFARCLGSQPRSAAAPWWLPVRTSFGTRKSSRDLEAAGFYCTLFGVPGEPDLALVREGSAAVRAHSCGVVIAIGGGSAIDAGKAIAALAANPGDVLDYLEVIGKGRALEQPPVPFYCGADDRGHRL